MSFPRQFFKNINGSGFWGRHWGLSVWIFRSLRLPTSRTIFNVIDLDFAPKNCDKDGDSESWFPPPWHFPPHHQYRLWGLLQLCIHCSVQLNEGTDRFLTKYNTLTWRNCNDPTKFCPPKDFFLTMEPWKNRSLSMLKFRGRSADIKPYVLRMNLAILCNNTKTWQTNTTLRFSISSSKIETIDWFYGMKLATQSTKQCRCGLSTSFGSRFGWKANTVRSRVFCSMTNHTWLLGCGFHGGMDSNQVGRAMVGGAVSSYIQHSLPHCVCMVAKYYQVHDVILHRNTCTKSTLRISLPPPPSAHKHLPLPTIKISEVFCFWKQVSHHSALAMPQVKFWMNQCCDGLKLHHVANSKIPRKENQYTIHFRDNTSMCATSDCIAFGPLWKKLFGKQRHTYEPTLGICAKAGQMEWCAYRMYAETPAFRKIKTYIYIYTPLSLDMLCFAIMVFLTHL